MTYGILKVQGSQLSSVVGDRLVGDCEMSLIGRFWMQVLRLWEEQDAHFMVFKGLYTTQVNENHMLLLTS